MSNIVKAQTNTIRGLLESEDFKKQVARVLPKHLTPERFIRVAATATLRVPALAQCDHASFFNSLLTLSQLGLEPDGRNAHLIPFRNNKTGKTECQLIIDYKGLVDLAMRSGTVANIHADKVCENDVFEFNLGEIQKHVINFREPRGKAYAYYAMVRFKDGTTKCEVMTKDEVDSIRKRSRAGTSGPWVTDYDEMAKKTAFRRLSKWIQLSPEFRDALEHDADKIENVRFESAKPVFAIRTDEPQKAQDQENLEKPEPPAEPPLPEEEPETRAEFEEPETLYDGPTLQERIKYNLHDDRIDEIDFLKWVKRVSKKAYGSVYEMSDAHAEEILKNWETIIEDIKNGN